MSGCVMRRVRSPPWPGPGPLPVQAVAAALEVCLRAQGWSLEPPPAEFLPDPAGLDATTPGTDIASGRGGAALSDEQPGGSDSDDPLGLDDPGSGSDYVPGEAEDFVEESSGEPCLPFWSGARRGCVVPERAPSAKWGPSLPDGWRRGTCTAGPLSPATSPAPWTGDAALSDPSPPPPFFSSACAAGKAAATTRRRGRRAQALDAKPGGRLREESGARTYKGRAHARAQGARAVRQSPPAEEAPTVIASVRPVQRGRRRPGDLRSQRASLSSLLETPALWLLGRCRAHAGGMLSRPLRVYSKGHAEPVS